MLVNQFREEAFDIVVVGGGSAGIAAAVGAAKMGRKVALIEKYGFLGGAATISSVQAYCGFYTQTREQVVGGVGAEVIELLQEVGFADIQTQKRSGNTIVIFNPESLKVALDRLVQRYNISLYLHTTVHDVISENQQISHILASHRGGCVQLSAQQFIDTSGDGVLIQKSHADTHITLAEQRQGNTLVMQIGGVASNATTHPAEINHAIINHSQLKETLENNVAVRIPNTETIMLLAANERFDVFSVEEATQAETSARAKAHAYIEALRTLPGWEQAFIFNTGPQIGIRESLRIKGKDTVEANFVFEAKKIPDQAIARCGWPIEDHSIAGKTQYTPIHDKGWFHIPIGALQSQNISNLWAGGRLISSDQQAYTSIRVMGTAFATGHAAGVAASFYADNSPQEHNVQDVRTIQHELIQQGAII